MRNSSPQKVPHATEDASPAGQPSRGVAPPELRARGQVFDPSGGAVKLVFTRPVQSSRPPPSVMPWCIAPQPTEEDLHVNGRKIAAVSLAATLLLLMTTGCAFLAGAAVGGAGGYILRDQGFKLQSPVEKEP